MSSAAAAAPHGPHTEEAARTDQAPAGSGPRRGQVTVKVVARPDSASQQVYVPAIIEGLGVTMRHFFRNLFSSREKSEIVTVQYPEEKVAYPVRYRGLHRLMHREDGSVRCVACMCCPTVCPAHCITIVAEETGNGAEKRPRIFEIDELRCIVCGLCVEACPCDAIRMDSGVHMKPSEHRHQAVLGKNDLMALGATSLAVQGGIGPSWPSEQKHRPE